jgi:hypothetical protein
LRLKEATELEKALKLSEAIALASNSENVLAQRKGGLILYDFQLASGYWESYSRADLPTSEAVGLAERRRPIAFQFDPPHTLIGGTTGSGKSETVKSILVALMTTYTPDELSLVLIDPNRDYTDLANVAHLAMPIAHDAEATRVALAWANQELVKRIDADNKAAKVLVVALDEAESGHVLGNSTNFELALNITRQGRKYHVHLLVATKRPTQKDFPGLIDQLLNRFVGQVSNASESSMLTGHAGLNAHKLTGKGDFLHVAGPLSERFQVALATQADFERLERVEVKPVTIEPDLIEFPTLPLAKQVGRPRLEVQPEIAAWYFLMGPQNVSRAMASDLMNLSRDSHELHRDFVRNFGKVYRQLKTQQLQIGA